MGLPPYIGLLFGLGIVWIFLQFENTRNGEEHDVLDGIFKKLDIASINFYAGILLAANALYALGILAYLSNFLFGASQSFTKAVTGAIAAGLLFSVFDNIPLTALTLKLITLPQESLWILFALTIGNGGSVILIGSAAGIAVMSSLKELTTIKYIKIAAIATLLAYFAMVAVWMLQYNLFLK